MFVTPASRLEQRDSATEPVTLKIPDLTLAEDFRDAASDPFLIQLEDLARPNQASDESGGPGRGLRIARHANAATNLVKEAVFDKVVAHLTACGVEVIAPYKGMYLLLTLYRDCPWIRPMGDVDFIVRRKDFAKVREALKTIGRVHPTNPGRPLWSAVFHEFSARVDGVNFDVHRGFTPLQVYGLDTDRMLEEAAVVSNSEGNVLRQLPLPEATALQIFHDLSAGLSGQACLTFERLAQVYLMINNARFEQVKEACGGLGIERFLAVYVALLERVFPRMPFSSSALEVPAFVADVRRGASTPFEYAGGEFRFKARLFKGALLRKFLPRLLLPLDVVLNRLGVRSLSSGAYSDSESKAGNSES